MELGDVVLAGDQDAAPGVGAGGHRRLGALAGVEVLPVDKVEQLDRPGDVLARCHDAGIEQPVADYRRPVWRERDHAVQDHVVGYQVDEHLRPDGDREVPAVLLVCDPGQAGEAGAAVDGEARRTVGEGRAVPHVVLSGVAAGELRQHAGQLRVDRRAVVALHEVLDDELPVGRDVVGDAPADGKLTELVGVDGLHGAQPGRYRAAHGVLERWWLVGQAHPRVAEPLAERDGHQAVFVPVDVGHAGQVRRRRQPPAQVVGPRVVGTAQVPRDLTGLLDAEPGPAVAADVQERAQPAVLLPDDQHAFPSGLDHLELSRTGKVAGTGRAQPLAFEDELLLAGERCAIDVAGPGEGGKQAAADGRTRLHGSLLASSARGRRRGGVAGSRPAHASCLPRR